jgi:MerR family transcriptional regulator/heat shock protein HspR
MERDQDAALYVISVAADLAGVHPQTLRLYERKGLVDPARSAGGNRRYSERDLTRLRRIGDLTSAGVNLEGVRRILDLEHDNATLRAELDRARAEAAAAVEATHRQYRRELLPYEAASVPRQLWHHPMINEGTPGSDSDGATRRRV